MKKLNKQMMKPFVGSQEGQNPTKWFWRVSC